MPKGYFDAASTRLVTVFRDVVLADRREELLEGFPEAALAGRLEKTWHAAATSIYGNWLRYVASKKGDVAKFSAVAAVHENVGPKRSVLR
jgi:homoserine trans-succinylase